MMHKAWSSIEEVPNCFSRSSVKFQGHIALKIVEFDSNWAFPDCKSSLNSPMAMKCCTKLETAKKRCPIVFQGHPWNFKVTRDKTSPIFTQIGRFPTIGRSQLSNPSDLPCFFRQNRDIIDFNVGNILGTGLSQFIQTVSLKSDILEVWKWISNLILHYNWCNYTSMLGLRLNHLSERDPCCECKKVNIWMA